MSDDVNAESPFAPAQQQQPSQQVVFPPTPDASPAELRAHAAADVTSEVASGEVALSDDAPPPPPTQALFVADGGGSCGADVVNASGDQQTAHDAPSDVTQGTRVL